MPVMCTEIESGGRRNRIPLADAVKTLAPHWHMKAKDIEDAAGERLARIDLWDGLQYEAGGPSGDESGLN